MNDYLKTKELYHFGIKGMRWGIRKGPAQEQESEYNKASKSRIEKSKVLGGVGGALAAIAVGIYSQLHGFKDISGKKKG